MRGFGSVVFVFQVFAYSHIIIDNFCLRAQAKEKTRAMWRALFWLIIIFLIYIIINELTI